MKGPAACEASALVLAKVPVPGQAKTRLGASVGHQGAAWLALAALRDTLAVCATVFAPGRRVVALAGDRTACVDPEGLSVALAGWIVLPQRGSMFADRLVAAHRDAHAAVGGPVVQLGMDTPQVTGDHLRAVVRATAPGRPVLSRAGDGGWWVLASTDAREVEGLERVPMSSPDTWERTRDHLVALGSASVHTEVLDDVDTAADADRVAAAWPGTRFARHWRATLSRGQPVAVVS